jgi:hypothetical protein
VNRNVDAHVSFIAGLQIREPSAISTPCRFGNRRYSRFGNLRYAEFTSVRQSSYEMTWLKPGIRKPSRQLT